MGVIFSLGLGPHSYKQLSEKDPLREMFNVGEAAENLVKRSRSSEKL